MNYQDWPDEMTAEDYLNRIGQRQAVAMAAAPRRNHTNWVQTLAAQIQAAGLPEPQREFRFHPSRQWRFDFAWETPKVAIEVDGGIWGRPVVCPTCQQQVTRVLKNGRVVIVREGGRHNTGQGFEDDREKWAEAALLGWRVIGVTPGMIEDGRALDFAQRSLGGG